MSHYKEIMIKLNLTANYIIIWLTDWLNKKIVVSKNISLIKKRGVKCNTSRASVASLYDEWNILRHETMFIQSISQSEN